MAATINTNLASINAQRNLSMSGQSLNTTMQRLSSGLRVNSAKDDAAGLAIAERMSTQVRGLTVASRNANDGISLAQTAEGALGKVGDMLQRMRELAVQASNATNSASDRTALQAEVSQLAAEIDRVAKQTNFNGQKILDGSFAGAVFQVGANSGDNVTLGALADVRSSKLSLVNYAQGMVALSANDDPKPAIANYATGIAAGELRITVGTTPPQSIALEAIKPAISSLERLGQVVTAINNRSTDTGVVAFMHRNDATGNYEIQFMSEKTDAVGKPLSIGFEGFSQSTTGIGPSSTSGVKSFSPVPALNAVAAPAAFLMTEQGGYVETPKLAAVVNYRDHLSSINEGLGMNPAVFELKELNQAISNYQSAAAQSPVDSLALDAAAADINEALATLQNLRQSGTFESDMNALIKNNNALAQTNPNALMASLSSESTPEDVANVVTLLKEYGVSTSGFKLSKFQDGNAWSTESGKTVDDALAALGNLVSEQVSGGLNLTAADHATNVRGLDTIDVTSQEGAWIGLKKIDSAIDQINASRATLGAMQTRFETAVNNIDIQVENLSAARGRIMDADFAVETANLSRTKILQEAGTAMVAQANQIPQNVLKLLQG